MDTGRTGWGTTLNNNFTIIDSSMCSLAGTNNISGTFNFIDAGGPIFKNASGNGSSQIYNNGQSGKSELDLYGLDGVGVNTTNQMTNLRGIVDLAVYGGTVVDGTPAGGRFAVLGSSVDGSVAYSGFRSTGPISASTLWSLPKADGLGGSPLTTDGSAHLSFGQGGITLKSSAGLASSISMYGANGNLILIQTPGALTGYQLVLPTQQGQSKTALVNDGAGNLSFTTTFSSPTASGYTKFMSRTKASIQAIVPDDVGETYYCSDCATAVLCISSGTSTNQFYSSTSRSTGCQ